MRKPSTATAHGDSGAPLLPQTARIVPVQSVETPLLSA